MLCDLGARGMLCLNLIEMILDIWIFSFYEKITVVIIPALQELELLILISFLLLSSKAHNLLPLTFNVLDSVTRLLVFLMKLSKCLFFVSVLLTFLCDLLKMFCMEINLLHSFIQKSDLIFSLEKFTRLAYTLGLTHSGLHISMVVLRMHPYLPTII